ncbi:hypothetical protein [Halorubrum tebenquichense]|uniref:hypothetical protein n=1 Tax=Halorubrum tebenquichense TaxID=119434 RepID=UPI0012678627|nr:hypothetical protein [Halorubrum tebenquichense]
MSSWIQLDEHRVTWIFVVLGWSHDSEKQSPSNPQANQLTHWELGAGNSESLVRTVAERIDREGIGSEKQLVHELLVELDQYRHNGSTIITPRPKDVRYLRQKILRLSRGDTTPTLRGFSQVNLGDVLAEYFGQELSDYDIDPQTLPSPRVAEDGSETIVSAGAVREYWDCWARISNLVPASHLAGDQL